MGESTRCREVVTEKIYFSPDKWSHNHCHCNAIMKRPGAWGGGGDHKRVRHTSASPSHFYGTSRIKAPELRDTIVSSANDPSTASRLSNRVLIERVTYIDDHDPSAIIFACETVPEFSGASYGVTKFGVKLTGKFVQDVRAVVRKLSYLGTPQPLKLLLRGGIFTPTQDPEVPFCLSFKDGVTFRFGSLEEMSFGAERRLISFTVASSPLSLPPS